MVAFSALCAVAATAQTEDAPARNMTMAGQGSDLTTARPYDPHCVTPPMVKSATVSNKFIKLPDTGYPATSPRKLRKASAEIAMPKLVGNVIYSKTLTSYGMYEIATSETGEFKQLMTSVDATNGGVCVDGVYYAVSSQPYGFNKYNVKIDSYDADTWELIETRKSQDAGLIADDVALDPVSGRVYGCFLSDDCLSYVFGYIDYATLKRTIVKAGINRLNAIAVDTAGVVYGIQLDGNLVKINKETGDITVVGNTGLSPQYSSSATIDPATNRLYYAISDAKNKSYLVEINKDDASSTQVLEYTNGDEITGMYVPTPPNPDAPSTATDLALNFDKGALSGTLSFTAPSTTNGGAQGTGALTYTVAVNGDDYASGSTSYGQVVTVPLTVAEPGQYTATVAVANSVGKSSKAKVEAYIGSGAPKAPVAKLEREGDNFRVTWSKVKEAANGGYFDAEQVTYKVTRYPDTTVLAEATADTVLIDAVAEPAQITSYYYTVVASFNGMKSAEAKTNSVTIGKIVPPYNEPFDTQESAQGYTVIDANSDGRTWEWQKGGYMRVRYDSRNKTDDWLVTPPVKMEKGLLYKVSFDAWGTNARNAEVVEVKYGLDSTVEALQNTMLEPDTILSCSASAPRHYTMRLLAKENGVYYIGFHGISEPDKYGLNIDNIEIEAGMSAATPAAPTGFTVTPAADGSKTAVVTLVCPDKNSDGSALESLTKVEVYRGSDLIKAFSNPAVGAELSFEDSVPANGEYTYKAIAYSEYGPGASAEVTVNVGNSAPEQPSSFTIAETDNMGEVHASWSPVTKDVNGNQLVAADVTYTILDDENNVIATGITGTDYTFQAVNASDEQSFVYYYLKAVTGAHESEAIFSNLLPVGTPYTVPYTESVAGGKTGSIFGLATITPSGAWQIGVDGLYSDIKSADGDGGYLFFRGDNVNASASISTGKISLVGVKNPALSVYVDNLLGSDEQDDLSELDIYAVCDGHQTLLKHVVPAELPEVGWNKVVLSLEQFAGKSVYFTFIGTVKNYRNTVIDQIKVYSRTDNNIAITDFSAPTYVFPNKEFKIGVKVENTGANDASDWGVSLSLDGKQIDHTQCEALASGQSRLVEFSVTPSVLSEKEGKYAADVVCAADDNADDNHAEASVGLVKPNYPVVESLSGSMGESGLQLTWTAPDLSKAAPEETFENFEKATSWANTYGDWTFVDYDKSPVMGINGVTLPNVALGSLQSFFVMEHNDSVFGESKNMAAYASHSGVKHLSTMACYYDNVASDDWAISPELYGGEQLITFYAKSYSAYLKENVEVLYSTTGTDRACFKSLGDNVAIDNVWKLYQYLLPQGTKYFALRSHGTGNWMCFVDDVTYTGKGTPAPLSVLGYNVYRNGEKINSDLVTATSYSDAEATAGQAYVVTTVYDKGESGASPEYKVEATGLSTVVTDDSNAPVEYFNMQGVRVPAGLLDTGVYIRRQGSRATKVVIK